MSELEPTQSDLTPENAVPGEPPLNPVQTDALTESPDVLAEETGLAPVAEDLRKEQIETALVSEDLKETLLAEAAAIRPADPMLLKAELESALFITGKPLSLQELAELVEAPVDDVELAIGELIQDYAFREGCGLEIDDTDGYILQVREDCSRIVNKMMPLEMSPATLRTLSAIAIKAPIVQSDLIELRGSSAYEHIAELLSRKLISKRRQGRSFVLNTTKSFDEYFKLQGNKRELEALVNRLRPEHRPTDAAAAEQAEPGHAESAEFNELIANDDSLSA